MGAQQGQDQGAEKNAYYVFWLVVLIVIAAAVIWNFFHYQLKWFFIYVRLIEFELIHFFVNLVPKWVPWIGPITYQEAQSTGMLLNTAKDLTPAGLSLDLANVLSNSAGSYLRYPLIPYFIFLCYVVYKRNVKMRLKTKFNMNTLAAQEKELWPQIKIVQNANLLEADLDSGPWAMAMTPVQFARKNRLVTIERAVAQAKFSKMKLPEYKATLNRVRAARAFSVQIGRSFQGLAHMPNHRRAIFAIFAARGLRDKTAHDLVAQLASSAASGTLDCTGADELWQKHLKNERLQKMINSHAYELTLFISMVLFAREDGVVPSSDFLWLKPIDRRLWYTINSVGRQTPCVEAGGVFSHWYYEMTLGRALSAPRVDEAVTGLELALSEVIYQPTDEEKEEIAEREKTTEQET